MSQESITQKEGATIQASFQQKSTGVSLFIVGSTTAYYIAQAWPMRPIALAGTTIPEGFGGLVLTTLGLIIFAEIVLQIVLVIGSGTAAKATAHEKMAALKAKQIAYGVLAAGLLAVIVLLFVGFPAFCMANIAMVALLLSETVKFTAQMIYGRRTA